MQPLTDFLAGIVSALMAGGIAMLIAFHVRPHWLWGLLIYSIAYIIIRLLIFGIMEYRCNH